MGRKILAMSRPFFLDLWKGGESHYRVVKDPLPDDVRLVKVSMDLFFGVDTVAFMLESDEWPEVPSGHNVPQIEPIFETIHPEPTKSWRDDPLL